MAKIRFSSLRRSSEDLTVSSSETHSVPPPSKRSIYVGKPSQTLFQTQNRKELPPIQLFFSAKGGSGTSMIASTFAGVVRHLLQVRVLLVDLDLSSGGIQSYAGIEAARSILDLKPVMRELTETHIRNVVQFDQISAIDVLAGFDDISMTDRIVPEEIRLFLTEAAKQYELIVIDGGSRMTPNLLPLLRHADQIHYILTPETPSLTKYHQTLSFCKNAGIPHENMGVILNRAAHINEIQAKDIKGLQPFRIEGVIRSDYAAIQSNVNLGIPLISRLRDKKPPKVLLDIMRMTREWAGQVESFVGSVGDPL